MTPRYTVVWENTRDYGNGVLSRCTHVSIVEAITVELAIQRCLADAVPGWVPRLLCVFDEEGIPIHPELVHFAAMGLDPGTRWLITRLPRV